MFGVDGLLSRSPDFEYRPEQQRMARLVAESLEKGEPLVVEAGTGVGKSLAYLLPAARFALREDRPAIISTHTINLQEQLMNKDLPIVRKILADELPAALLKGRQNYLCPRRLQRTMEQAADLFTKSERDQLRAVAEWAHTTFDGTRSDLDAFVSAKVWSQVCSEAWICTQKHCGPRGNCFYQEARKRVNDARVIIVNHSLFFALMQAMEEEEETDGHLLPNDFVIFDEAHTLEEVAADAFGLRISQIGLRFELQRLYHPRTKKGILKNAGATGAILAVERTQEELEKFFQAIQEVVSFKGPQREFRVRETELVENTLAAPLRQSWSAIEDAIRDDDDEENESAKGELRDSARRLREAGAALAAFLDHEQDRSVYWVEKTGSDSGQLTLRSAPVEVSERLRPRFFSEGKHCLMTSATLGTGDPSLSYFRRRMGAEEATAEVIGSPFDYAHQMKVYVVKSMPDPREAAYAEMLVHWIRRVLDKSEGRAFVLFTSHRLLRDTAAELESFLERKGWRQLVQGDGMSRARMIDIFRRDTHSVLFGTASFWTGVDVPGEALSNVIITRLPFAVPDHPLTQAHLEDIEAEGKNPFMEYSLPEAVLKFRQGIGRLIRTKKDKGMVVILDPRVLTKFYGKKFLAALPNAPVRAIE